MDERFAKVIKDPRFKRIPKKERKVKIDSRFKRMFTDDQFHTKVSVDKRGKPLMENEKEDLHQFYELDSDDDSCQQVNEKAANNTGDKKKVRKGKEKKANLDIKTKDIKVKKSKKLTKLTENDLNKALEKKQSINFDDIRGDTVDSTDDDEDCSEIDSDVEEGVIHGWGALDGDVKRIENAETSRLAVCNCDWDKINATDLFILFHSFKPVGGSIKCVTIYPSNYGIERMKEEDLMGPQELKSTSHVDGDDESDEEKEEGSQYHMEKLRKYQMNRMKYYYAVLDCDSKETACKIYTECDGLEYEMSSTRLDLRYIPDDTTFENPPKSVVKDLPNIKNYQPVNFLNTALQQSTVRLTWDETDPKRLESTMRKFTADDLENMDFKDYLASSSDKDSDDEHVSNQRFDNHSNSDSDDNSVNQEDQPIQKYRLLMQELEGKEKVTEEEGEGNMEFTWTPGLSQVGEKIIQAKNDIANDKKKKKKIMEEMASSDKMNSQNDEGDDDDDEDIGDGDEGDDLSEDGGFNDPFFNDALTDKSGKKDKKMKKKKKKQHSEENISEEELKRKNELELLLMDESEEKKHFSLKTILTQNKKTKSKNNKRKKGKEVEEDTFNVDVEDPRFNALFTSHMFAIDPAEPQFKKTKATEAIIKEKQRRREVSSSVHDVDENTEINHDKMDASLSALVKSVKWKTQTHQMSKKKKLKR